MTPKYTYINSPDYIDSLSFEYVETYSFQRGEAYERQQEQLEAELNDLKVRKSQGQHLTAGEESRYAELEELTGLSQYLIDDGGRFHPWSEKKNTFLRSDPALERIRQILRTEVVDVPIWMCAPVYRDALVFYDRSGQIVSVLNVCLWCQRMETKMFDYIEGDFRTYDLLKDFFQWAGHEVEEMDEAAED